MKLKLYFFLENVSLSASMHALSNLSTRSNRLSPRNIL